MDRYCKKSKSPTIQGEITKTMKYPTGYSSSPYSPHLDPQFTPLPFTPHSMCLIIVLFVVLYTNAAYTAIIRPTPPPTPLTTLPDIPIPSTLEYPVDWEDRVREFEEWVVREGGELDGVKVVKQFGWFGIEASRDLPSGHVAVRLPYHLHMRSSTAMSDERVNRSIARALATVPASEGIVPLEGDLVGDFRCLLLYLYHERFLGLDASYWRPYIRLLPSHFPLPYTYSAAEKAFFARSPIEKRLLEHTETCMNAMVDWCDRGVVVAFGEEEGVDAGERRKRCEWSFGVLKTRMYGPRFSNGMEVTTPDGGKGVFKVGDKNSLFPVLDLFNMDAGTHIPDVHLHGSTYDMIHATKAPVEEGEMLMETYFGFPGCSSVLLANYGFIPPIHDAGGHLRHCATIYLPFPTEQDALQTLAAHGSKDCDGTRAAKQALDPSQPNPSPIIPMPFLQTPQKLIGNCLLEIARAVTRWDGSGCGKKKWLRLLLDAIKEEKDGVLSGVTEALETIGPTYAVASTIAMRKSQIVALDWLRDAVYEEWRKVLEEDEGT